MGWRDRTPKSTSSTATRVTVGDGETVQVTNSGGSNGYHRSGGWRDRLAADVSSSVTAGEGSRVSEKSGKGDVSHTS